jgi:O-antigen ligase
MLTHPTGWRVKVPITVMTMVTLVAPEGGLMAIALLAPTGMAVGMALKTLPYRMTEALVMAFLAAWLLRTRDDREGPRAPAVMTAAGSLLGAAVVLSVAVVAWSMRDHPEDLNITRAWLVGSYFMFIDRIGFTDAARIIEGIGLVAASLVLFRRRPILADRLPAALAIGGASAATAAVLIFRGIGPPMLVNAFARIGFRAAHIFDVNAAGSYFAMLVFLSAGMAVRATGRARGAWTALTLANGIGLWFSESKSAFVAAVVTAILAAVWVSSARLATRARVIAVAIAVVLGVAGSLVRAWMLERDPGFRGSGLRQQFYATSLRMIEARPLSGVGIGQYSRTSTLFLSPQLAWTYGGENAHNYFLQVGGELGIPGFVFFILWIGTPFVVAGRALARGPDPRLLGAAAGILAFVSTCATGHPLLVDEVAFPFWIQFGLMLALAASPLVEAPPAVRSFTRGNRPVLSSIAAALSCVVVGGGMVSAAQGSVKPPSSQAVDGLYPWENDEGGRRFRWTEQYGSLFVPAETRRISIPMRVPVDRPVIVPMRVDFATGGTNHQIVLVGTNWETVDLDLPDVAPPVRFKRIDFKTVRTWQPALYIAGSYDMRPVGMQIGECELSR